MAILNFIKPDKVHHLFAAVDAAPKLASDKRDALAHFAPVVLGVFFAVDRHLALGRRVVGADRRYERRFPSAVRPEQRPALALENAPAYVVDYFPVGDKRQPANV